MPHPVSYPGLKSVLEHLELTKRFHIAARTPSIKRINHVVPLQVETLKINSSGLTMNQLSISYDGGDEVEFESKKNHRRVKRNVPLDLSQDEAHEMILDFYLKGRLDVKNLFVGFPIIRLPIPTSLVLHVDNVVASFCDFEGLTSKIHPKNSLKELTTTIFQPIILDHPILNPVKKLTISVVGTRQSETRLPDIHKIRNKNILIKYVDYEPDDIVRIIKYWKENGKQAGTKYLFSYRGKNHLHNVMKMLQGEFKEFQDNLEEVKENFVKSAPRFAISMRSTAKILLYAVENLSHDQVVLRVV